MDYNNMQRSWDSSYSSEVCNLYPYPQPRVYPPPDSEGGGYQTYFGEENSPYGWSQQQAAPSDESYYYGYQSDSNCLTFLRGCLAGLCCCCLLEQFCYYCYYPPRIRD